jgi:hypothetical protein
MVVDVLSILPYSLEPFEIIVFWQILLNHGNVVH